MSINYHQYSEGREIQQSSLAWGGLSPFNDLKPNSLQAWRANWTRRNITNCSPLYSLSSWWGYYSVTTEKSEVKAKPFHLWTKTSLLPIYFFFFSFCVIPYERASFLSSCILLSSLLGARQVSVSISQFHKLTDAKPCASCYPGSHSLLLLSSKVWTEGLWHRVSSGQEPSEPPKTHAGKIKYDIQGEEQGRCVNLLGMSWIGWRLN